jgi:hypothetical protein
MVPALPNPIAAYVEANAQLDVDGMLKPFAPDAVLSDNGKLHEGHAELRTLFEEEVVAVRAIFTRTPFATRTVRSWSKVSPMATSRAARSASPIASRSKKTPSKHWGSRYEHQS